MAVACYYGVPLNEITGKNYIRKTNRLASLFPFSTPVRMGNLRFIFVLLITAGFLTSAPFFFMNVYKTKFEKSQVYLDKPQSNPENDMAQDIAIHAISTLEGISHGKLGANMNGVSSRNDSQYIHNSSSSRVNLPEEIPTNLSIAVINLPNPGISALKMAFPGSIIVPIDVDTKKINSWEEIYPPMHPFNPTSCPYLPHLKYDQFKNLFDIVVVNAPCNPLDPSWIRNVSRHLLLLAAADLAVNHTIGVSASVIVMSQCPPTPGLFRCSDLRERRADLWLFNVNRQDMKGRTLQPVGSCGIASPTTNRDHEKSHREAYVTFIYSTNSQICGALSLGTSLNRSGTTRDLVLLHDSQLGLKDQNALRSIGWSLHEIEPIVNPRSKPNLNSEWDYSKLRLWQLTQFDKIVYVDIEILVVRNMDFLFGYPELSAATNAGQPLIFNSGLMVIEPSMCTFDMIMSFIKGPISFFNEYQGILNEYFTWWHKIPYEVNILKYTDRSIAEDVAIKSKIFKGDPPPVYGIHYLDLKPWECLKDFDCNWIQDPRFANDDAHEFWWKIHDLLPEQYQPYCYLDESQKKKLGELISDAKANGRDPKYWNLTVQDKRFYLQNSV